MKACIGLGMTIEGRKVSSDTGRLGTLLPRDVHSVTITNQTH